MKSLVILFATVFVYAGTVQVLLGLVTQSPAWWFCGGWIGYIIWDNGVHPFLAHKFPNLFEV